MTTQDKEVSVYQVTYKILKKIANQRETPAGKATLAKLRNSLGRSLNGTSEVWPILFENLPESYLGRKETLTAQEQAILTSLQLYAIHQQGLSADILNLEDGYYTLGASFRLIRKEESKNALDQRFNTLITSASYEELVHHLRQLIKLLRSKAKDSGKVNYAKLSQDLYWYLRGYHENVKLNWSRDYYRTMNKGEKLNDEQ